MDKKQYRIVLMGTPEFAVNVFKPILDDGWNVVGLVSQPDRPIGRKHIIMPTPTKVLASEYNVPVYQVEKIKNDYAFLEELKPDLIVTCAYGQIVPQVVLDLPKYGCINVHASLLPKLRGGAPIHRSIMNGDQKTGITIMEMTAKMDAGKMFVQESIDILDSDNLETLSDKLCKLGGKMIVDFLPHYFDNDVNPIAQNENEVTYGYNIKREEERIDWNKSSRDIFNHVRALYPNPGTYTTLNDKICKIYRVSLANTICDDETINGTIISLKEGIIVKVNSGAIRIDELQLEGKKRVSAIDFARGLGNTLLNQRFK